MTSEARPVPILPHRMTTPEPITPLAPPASFLSAAQGLGIEFEPSDLGQLGYYLALLLETNKVHNLTAITDPEQAWTRHILDSLTLLAPLSQLPSSDGPARVIDVGSGGGLPGIPLAICMPDHHFTLLEATGKKIDFLKRIASDLGLGNITVLQGRAETVGQDHKKHREMYDAAIARAVGPLSVIAELTIPLVKVGGHAFLIKGAKADEELAAAKQALHALHTAHTATLDTPTGRIIVLEKLRKTPRLYPRADGEPKRKPL